MALCPHCSHETVAAVRFCPECGRPWDASSATPTELREGAPTSDPAPSRGPSPTTSGSFEGARFLPGAVLAERYRIVGPLGKGGMGEVYRADDLKLGQAVALKFLPEELQEDGDRLQRFLHEVKLTRQISHPNVCRVYDAGDVQGVHFLSMEYIDGEDLASLLRRIGRLPQDKAIQIARQLCAGLAAAHEMDILHRDLKPANVMIDGRGRARITDFGIAAVAGDIDRTDIRIGTPAYMAPEQLSGETVSVRSDVYSLGLVLYELFTGKTAFQAGSIEELQRLQTETTPTSPSTFLEGFDPAVERILLRCLDRDPARRPGSALAVAAALPGGDPLAAALAAGETPSPEMVAAAGEEGALSPPVAWSCLAGALILLAAVTVVSGTTSLLSRSRLLPKPRQVLEDRSHRILDRLGHEAPAHDQASGFGRLHDYLRWIQERDPTPDRWDRLDTDREWAVYFFYRQSPQQMNPFPGFFVVWEGNPPLEATGAADLWLDAAGRLVWLDIVPPDVASYEETPPEVDWSVLFDEAEMDPDRFAPAAPLFTPAVAYDTRRAWEGTFEEAPDMVMRVEAAAFRGRIVHFGVNPPWRGTEPFEPPAPSFWRSVLNSSDVAITIITLVVAAFMARRNLRLGRSDRAGAIRLALTFLGIHVLVWAFWSHHIPDLGAEWNSNFRMDTGYSMFLMATLWLYYVGLEPFVRRRWPDAIISWTRLLAGRFRDPLVGRDVLVGLIFGLGMTLIGELGRWVPVWLGAAPPAPASGSQAMLRGIHWVLPQLVDVPVHQVIRGMQAVFILVLLRVLLRERRIASVAFIVLFTFLEFGVDDYWMIEWPLGLLLMSLGLFLLTRFGLVGMTAALVVVQLRDDMILTLDWSAWYAASSVAAVLFLTVVAIWAFHTSLGGRPLLGAGLLDE